MIINHFHIEDKKIINISSFLAYKEDDEYKYQYIKGENECNICFEFFLEFFKCKQCIFISCPQCFNKFYFNNEKPKCPMCRLC